MRGSRACDCNPSVEFFGGKSILTNLARPENPTGHEGTMQKIPSHVKLPWIPELWLNFDEQRKTMICKDYSVRNQVNKFQSGCVPGAALAVISL
jgi:hypothetical protein